MNNNRIVWGALAFGAAMLASPVFAAEEAVDAASIVIPAAPEGKGQVVFFRKGGIAGSAVACSVHENGEKISSLGGGRYVIVAAAPGRHEYSVKTEATDTLALEVEEGETQYASCKIKMGLMVGRPDIKPATVAEFKAAKKLKLVDDDDMGPGALRAAEVEAALAGKSAPAASAEAASEEAAAEPALQVEGATDGE